MIVRIREEAEAELEAAFDYYESRSAGVGHRFLDEYVHATIQSPRRRNVGPKIHPTPVREDTG
jgi:hypothetical protein